MKLWGGRFSKSTDMVVDDFNSSIRFDQRLFREDIQGSIAHVTMLAAVQILSESERDTIIHGLKDLEKSIENNEVEFDISAEDIHMNIETLLIQQIGDVAKKMHTGRSRNDQVATDMRLYIKKEVQAIDQDVFKLLETLLKLSQEHIETIMPGYTHLQKAQPTTLSHHLMAYFEMFKRDRDRLATSYHRMNQSPLGAGAFATTTYPLDRNMTAELLDFDAICLNSMDAVSDRDFLLDVLYALSMIMMHLSRFSEEIILWCSHEFRFIDLDDAYSTGSSIMPQKKNPDIPELIRGKTGRVYGDLMSLLTTMKGLPLAYNKDTQEDKEVTFDAIDTLKMCLPIFTKLLDTMTVRKEVMRSGAEGGFTNATDAADYLVKKGLAFRDAHEVIGKLVLYCVNNNTNLSKLSLSEYQNLSPLFEEDIFDAISLDTCVNKRQVIGGPAKEQMEKVNTYAATYLCDYPSI
ncbi:argininosuccinate lyase [Vallitaleaceae bacterium 9-2]